MTETPILEVEGLVKHFAVARSARRAPALVRAVDGVSLSLAPRETLALVGESGCGKTTTGRLIVRLLEPTDGRVSFDGTDITHARRRALRPVRRDLQIVFQDPYASLNPRLNVYDILAEPLRIHGRDRADESRRVRELLELVGLSTEHAERRPHEFSGGQRQRVAIARALALGPRVVVLDEPVSALDVSVQAQVVNLLETLQEELGLAFLFISHDLSVVRHIADRVAVMYLGKIVETGSTDDLFERPRHPYTKALLSAAPVADPLTQRRRTRIRLRGDVPSPAAPPAGCRFHTRCWKAAERCRVEVPDLADGTAACFFPEGDE